MAMSFGEWRAALKGESIAVVYGGHSNEREVSLQSGEAIASGLEAAGYVVRRVVLDGGVERQIDSVAGHLCFVGMHGRFGEDGELQAMLDERGIAYTGSGAEASRNAMDKGASKKIFQAARVPTPKYILVDRSDVESAPGADAIRYPAAVKPASCGSSIGVTVRVGPGELDVALMSAFEHDDRVIVEEYVEGRELTVGMLGARPLPVIELRTPRGFYDYEAKYLDEGTEYICPPELPAWVLERAQNAACQAYEALGCRDFGRVDLMLTGEGEPRVLEVNTIPGFTSHSLLPMAAKCAGVSFGELCERILAFALARSRGAAVADGAGAWRVAS